MKTFNLFLTEIAANKTTKSSDTKPETPEQIKGASLDAPLDVRTQVAVGSTRKANKGQAKQNDLRSRMSSAAEKNAPAIPDRNKDKKGVSDIESRDAQSRVQFRRDTDELEAIAGIDQEVKDIKDSPLPKATPKKKQSQPEPEPESDFGVEQGKEAKSQSDRDSEDYDPKAEPNSALDDLISKDRLPQKTDTAERLAQSDAEDKQRTHLLQRVTSAEKILSDWSLAVRTDDAKEPPTHLGQPYAQAGGEIRPSWVASNMDTNAETGKPIVTPETVKDLITFGEQSDDDGVPLGSGHLANRTNAPTRSASANNTIRRPSARGVIEYLHNELPMSDEIREYFGIDDNNYERLQNMKTLLTRAQDSSKEDFRFSDLQELQATMKPAEVTPEAIAEFKKLVAGGEGSKTKQDKGKGGQDGIYAAGASSGGKDIEKYGKSVKGKDGYDYKVSRNNRLWTGVDGTLSAYEGPDKEQLLAALDEYTKIYNNEGEVVYDLKDDKWEDGTPVDGQMNFDQLTYDIDLEKKNIKDGNGNPERLAILQKLQNMANKNRNNSMIEIHLAQLGTNYYVSGGGGLTMPTEHDLEHIRSLSAGGFDHPMNWVWADRHINQFRGANSTSDTIKSEIVKSYGGDITKYTKDMMARDIYEPQIAKLSKIHKQSLKGEAYKELSDEDKEQLEKTFKTKTAALRKKIKDYDPPDFPNLGFVDAKTIPADTLATDVGNFNRGGPATVKPSVDKIGMRKFDAAGNASPAKPRVPEDPNAINPKIMEKKDKILAILTDKYKKATIKADVRAAWNKTYTGTPYEITDKDTNTSSTTSSPVRRIPSTDKSIRRIPSSSPSTEEKPRRVIPSPIRRV